MRYILAFALVFSLPAYAKPPKTVQVDGHVKKDGTYVPPHNRTSPNSTTSDNWSTSPNVNPYTGKQGTKVPDPPKPPKKPTYSGL